MKIASLVSPCGVRAVAPRTMRVRGRSLRAGWAAGGSIASDMRLLLSTDRQQKTPTAKEVRVASRQHPDLLAVFLTWPQAGRLKSPRSLPLPHGRTYCQPAH